MLYLQLFITFFKIGIFGFGGGYAMISMIHNDVVTSSHWISSAEFADIVAISQSTPGPIGINAATYVGYTAAINSGFSTPMAVLASALATLAVVLPSFIMIMVIAGILRRYREHPVTKTIFSLLRPTVVGLLAAAAITLLTPDNFSTPDNPWQFYVSIFLGLSAFVGTVWFKVKPIPMLVMCGVAGFLLFYRQ